MADAGLGLIGQFPPALININTHLLQSPQDRRRILQIDEVIRRRFVIGSSRLRILRS